MHYRLLSHEELAYNELYSTEECYRWYAILFKNSMPNIVMK